MKFTLSYRLRVLLFLSVAALFSCKREDPGDIIPGSRNYSVADFSKIDIGSGMDITVTQGQNFSVSAHGDQRNINDLDIYKSGDILHAKFISPGTRKHVTYLEITMPVLSGVTFSGGTNSSVYGFNPGSENMEINLSGGSRSTMDISAGSAIVDISGGSHLTLNGTGNYLSAQVSGGSRLAAFNFAADTVNLDASGGSHVEVTANELLTVQASGASEVIYKGDPELHSDVSGASRIHSY